MEVKIWLKKQTIASDVCRNRTNKNKYSFEEIHSIATYETDLSVAEGLDTLYKVIKIFLNENGFKDVDELTVEDNGVYYSFELELDVHTEVRKAVVEISDKEDKQ